MIWWVTGLFILLWTVCGIWYFLSIMGYKWRKTKWYDYPILFPVGIIIALYAFTRKLLALVRKNETDRHYK